MTSLTVKDWLSAYAPARKGIADAVHLNARHVRPGFVVLMDALGFKDKWEQHGEDVLLRKFARIRRQVQAVNRRLKEDLDEEYDRLKPRYLLRYFSDTILLMVWPSGPMPAALLPPRPSKREWDQQHDSLSEDDLAASLVIAFRYAARVAARTYVASVRPNYQVLGDCPWCYRGSMSFGLFAYRGGSFVGEAVMDCAAVYEMPKAGVIACTESVRPFVKGPSAVSAELIACDASYVEAVTKPAWRDGKEVVAAHCPAKKSKCSQDEVALPFVVNPFAVLSGRAAPLFIEHAKDTFYGKDGKLNPHWGNTEQLLNHLAATVSTKERGMSYPTKEEKK